MKTKKKRSKILLIVLLALIIAGAGTTYFVLSANKSNFKITDTVKFKGFSIRVESVKTSAITLGELDDFYKPVWGRTAADLSDCSTNSTTKATLFGDSPKDNCERINGDINRDLASKVGIAQYLHSNERVDLTYKITSNNNSLQAGNIHTALVSGDENLVKKTFKYSFVYAHEPEVRYANNIDSGSLTKGLERTGLLWTDIKKSTSVMNIKVTYKGVVKTIRVEQPFKYQAL